jgi:hypothetical protein
MKNFYSYLIVALLLALSVTQAFAHPGGEPEPDDGEDHEHIGLLGGFRDPSDSLAALDSLLSGVVSSGPSAKVTKNLVAAGTGLRNSAGSTTDVWALGEFAYTGTFGSPCGGDPEAGVWVWDVHNRNKPSFVTIIPSPTGSRSNDVKVAAMNSGDVLVHSNESCSGGPGGFEIYDVNDPANPIHLAHVQTDDVNILLRESLGFTDFGVHNLFLFTQGSSDYVAATVESEFGNFQIFDISDPTNPTMVAFWGAESLLFPGVNFATTNDFGGVILPADAYLFSGFGASQNRFLHDITITADGSQAYLANWDAGLVLLDISDVTNPTLVSVAIDPTSEDGEVNSHAVWPSEDGTIVIEGEEDFAPYESQFSITSGTSAGDYPSSEATFTTPITSLPGSEMVGSTTYVGLACTGGDPVPAGSGIALIQRGTCRFDEKATNAINAGYSGMVVFNDVARGDALITMGGDPSAIPGVFVGHSTGLAIAGVADAASLVLGASGESVSAATVPNGWSGFRIWDFSDPANPVLASTFNTVCSASPNDSICDPAGTYSAHNVIVETTDDGKVKAYIAWYTDGIIVLDITDAYNPVEIGRYSDGNNFWGVYKVPNSPWIFGSDRNEGLYIIKEKGSGSGK